MLRKIFFNQWMLLFIVCCAALGGYLWWQQTQSISPEAKYTLQSVEKGDITQSVSANGTLNPLVLVTVGTQISGRVTKLYVDFNDRVEEGQVLAELDRSLLDAQVGQSEANVKSAEAALELAMANNKRSKELFTKEYISKQELDTSIQSLKSAQAALELAKAQRQKDLTNLGYTIIKSPVSGVVIDRQIDVGQTVAASLQAPVLFKIAQDLRKMQIDSNFAEADIGRIKVGQNVNFAVDAFPNRSFQGMVKQVRLNAVTTQNFVTYDVVVQVDNPEEILAPGMTAYVNVVIAEKKSIQMVPNAALRYKPAKNSPKDAVSPNGGGMKPKGKKETKDENMGVVYSLENNEPKAIKVKLGITDGRFTEIITDELKVGDKVITDENKANAKTNVAPPARMF